MKSLIRYLIKNHAFVLFILLETLAVAMVINYNSFQKTKYLNSANSLTGNIYNTYHSVTGYFGLKRINKELADENARLKKLINNSLVEYEKVDSIDIPDDKKNGIFNYIPAMVISNSVNRSANYLTLNKGFKDGIKPDQGIISSKGVVGVVGEVSESYSMGLSLLNRRWSISAKHKKSGYYGSLTWIEKNYKMANLTEIPLHVNLSPGDTVLTSGYSSIFPEGVLIGTIENFTQPEGENYYNIKIKLSVDFKSLSFVEVIENYDKNEIKQLENVLKNDQMDK